MNNRGFSLIEVTIFVAIISVFFVMVLQLATSSLATLKTTERRTYATRYAEELMEWLEAEKDNDWDNNFLPKTVLPVSTQTIYCFNGTITTWPTAGACAGYTLNSFFKREVSMSRQLNAGTDYQVTAIVTVSWQQGAGTMSVPVTTVFNKFE